MSDADSFIEEVTEEVRRDRLFALFRRYGWIAALVIVAVVGGAAYNEYRKAQETAAARAEAGETQEAVTALQRIARDGDLPEIYRQIASFKALTLQADTLPAEERRMQFEALARPGQPLRLLAEEQLALIDIATGQTGAAIDRLQAVLQDAEATAALRQRARQVIVALGGTPEPAPGRQQG